VISGNQVLQPIVNGISGNNYAVTSECVTSSGRKLAQGGILPCLYAYLQ
jgi:hypothetical protein